MHGHRSYLNSKQLDKSKSANQAGLVVKEVEEKLLAIYSYLWPSSAICCFLRLATYSNPWLSAGLELTTLKA